MVTVIFLRHGETNTSTDSDLIEGRSSTPINPVGERQARASAEAIRAAHAPSAVYSSPLHRARQTARILAERVAAPHVEHEGLFERDFGALEGRRWSEVEAEHGPDIRARDRNRAYDYRPWGGESIDDVKGRLGRFVSTLKERHDGQTVVCVTHGGVLRLLGFDVPWRASAEWFVVEI